MRLPALLLLVFALLPISPGVLSASEACLGCHDFGPDSPVRPMLESKHGDVEEGCEACHGPSEDHMSRPTIAPPDNSFGPRWSATVAQQNAQCLDCHRENVAAHWHDAQHMANDMTCVTCHDLHTSADPVIAEGGQSAVCTVCHRTQRDGIHAISDKKPENPDCTFCHNPHGDQSPVGMMLANRSEGCRNCHDLVAMAGSDRVTDRATSFHRVMVQKDRTCLDCHQGLAHGPTDAVEPFVPLPVSRRDVALFYPGPSDIDWILSEHPGAQPFRQGRNCQQCHRGDEASMGASLGQQEPSSRTVNVIFSEAAGQLSMRVRWQGSKNDKDIALMWGYGVNEAFRRGGCWAACHADMPGMSRDRGQGLGKYLSVSRSQQQRIGAPPLSMEPAELAELMAQGNFVEMWRINLQDGGNIEVATLLSKLNWLNDNDLSATASYSGGSWTVNVKRPLKAGSPLKPITAGKRYTFGMALHSKDRPGAEHWVSLPMTFSLDDNDSDFLAD